MKVDRLDLVNFRNLREVGFSPGPGANILMGDNAQGKTNLLEAVWLFTGSRSFRGSRDREYLRFGSERASLELNFTAQGREQTAGIALMGEKKSIHLNEIPQSRMGSLAGSFCAVVFSPDHLLLIKQGPEHRRRMLDDSLCQFYPKYQKVLEGYQRILRQRSRLLRDAAHHPALLDVLEAWDKNLIDYGAYLIRVRLRYVERLAREAREIYGGIARNRETFGACYRSTVGEDPKEQDKEHLREAFRKAVTAARGEDLRLGSTTVGPHRDDLEISIDGKSARVFGSQGQQRSCVLALKLAECGILEERHGEPPVVMLDDVMSELDSFRRSYLLNHLRDKQVLITCCDDSSFAELREGSVFRVAEGCVTPGKD